jgi:hypothetical protein
MVCLGVMHDAILPFIMNPTSPSSVHRRTPGMVYCLVLLGMRVTVVTPMLRSSMTKVLLGARRNLGDDP